MKKQRSLRLSSTSISVISQLSLNNDFNDVFNRNINMAILAAPKLLTILNANKIKKSKQWLIIEKEQKKANPEHSVVTSVLNEDVINTIESLFSETETANYSGTINSFFEGLNVAIKYYEDDDIGLSQAQYALIQKCYKKLPLHKLDILDEIKLVKYCLSGWIRNKSKAPINEREDALQAITKLDKRQVVLLLCRLRDMPV